MSGAIGDARNIDLNSASAEELDRIGGLGHGRVQRLIKARPFHSWDDVKRVEGFNDTLVNDLKRAGARIGGERAA